ncbi:Uncharacterised protein [Vibrio cholerae]|nr:Uncharacterised protein [Vibrio cholerae]
MIRVITLIPVCPSKRTIYGAERKSSQEQKLKATTVKMIPKVSSIFG